MPTILVLLQQIGYGLEPAKRRDVWCEVQEGPQYDASMFCPHGIRKRHPPGH